MKKIRTDNIPLLDELIYYLKKLSVSTILKDENQALKYETVESRRESHRYISSVENRVRFEMFDYNKEDLINAAIPEYLIPQCLEDKFNIPKNIRSALVCAKQSDYINNYIEQNNYYRSLNGLPDIDDEPIYLQDDYIPKEIKKDINIKIPLHQMNNSQLELLYEFKVIDRLKTKYPDKGYLDHLGFRSISIYDARTSKEFGLLYVDPDAPKEVLNRYKDKIEINRVYTLKCVYNEAFKIGSDYYDNFISVFIIIQTMLDILAEVPDMIIKREIFDIRTIELIFNCNGVDFFPEIPFKYQLAMVRNINRLIKYKSTTKNIVDICSLFGFDNIKVFKYYLLKERKVDKKGEYVFNYKEKKNEKTGKIEIVDDNMKNYDLKFIKVPIEGICDDYIHDQTKRIDYDIITQGDKYWDGDLPHDLVKQTIIDKEFNYLQSKYLSVDTVYSLTELSFQLVYFYNMLFDDVKTEEKLRLFVPCISGSANFKFVDIICYLYSLMYQYNEIEDDLMDTPTKIMYIKGFNFNADMTDLANYIHEKGFTMEELGIQDFQIPESSIMTYKQLMYVFTKNKNIYDHIVKQIANADNKKIYDVYYKIYESLMINEFNMEFFRMKNGEVAKTYTEFIQDRDLILYKSLMDIKSIKSKEIRDERISEQINSIIYILEEYVDTDKFKFLFANLPTVSAEAVKKYVFKVINFFKSYKVDILGIGTIYIFDDLLENKIKMIDEVLFKYVFTKSDTIEIIDKIYNNVYLTKEDKIKMIDKLYMDITYWSNILLEHDLNIKEKISSMVISSFKKDNSEITDSTNYIMSKLNKYSIVEYYDSIRNDINLSPEDRIKLIDKLFLDITYYAAVYCKDDIQIKETFKSLNIDIFKHDNILINDKKEYFANIAKQSLMNYYDQMKNKNITLSKDDKIKILDDMYINITFWRELYLRESERYELYSNTYTNISLYKKDYSKILDKISIKIFNK